MAVVGTNIARQGVATQSQVPLLKAKGAARYAIDGNTDGIFAKRSCTQTSRVNDPWWMVTFTDDILMTDVIITNRADCCGELCQHGCSYES